MKEKIKIKDDKNFSWIPDILRNCIMRSYQSQGFIYIKKVRGKEYSTTDITDVVKWLNVISVETFSESHANTIMFNYFNTTYPEYKGKINLF